MSKKTALRRLIITGASLGIAGMALTGCSTDQGGGDENTLTVATNGGDPMLAVISMFEEANPGVSVDVRDSPENYQQVVATQLTGNTAPDIIQVFPGNGNNLSVAIAGDRGYLADLTGADWAANLPESALELLTTDDDELVAVPMTFSSIGGIYNQGAIDDLGLTPPSTWDEVLQFCAAATDAGKVAYGLGLSDTWTTQLIPYALTATLVYGQDPEFVQHQLDGETSFADSAWRQALEQYLEMDEAGCFNTSPTGTPYSNVQQAIVDGSTLATVSVAAETETIGRLGPDDLELTFTAFPATSNADETVLSATTGPSFAVNAATSKQELAEKFIAFLAAPETQVAYAEAYGDTAALPGDLEQGTSVSAVVAEYVERNQTAYWPDQLWPTTAVQPALFDGVQAFFSGQNDIDGVLQDLDDAFNG